MLMDSIEPYRYNELKPFDMPYLSGHSAQRFDVPKEQVIDRVGARVNEAAEELFRGSMTGYSRLDVTSKEFRITNLNFKQAMMPAWFLTFTYKEKHYYFAMNGQTGKFGGTLPFNKPKLALFAFGIPMGALGLLALIFGILGGL